MHCQEQEARIESMTSSLPQYFPSLPLPASSCHYYLTHPPLPPSLPSYTSTPPSLHSYTSTGGSYKTDLPYLTRRSRRLCFLSSASSANLQPSSFQTSTPPSLPSSLSPSPYSQPYVLFSRRAFGLDPPLARRTNLCQVPWREGVAREAACKTRDGGREGGREGGEGGWGSSRRDRGTVGGGRRRGCGLEPWRPLSVYFSRATWQVVPTSLPPSLPPSGLRQASKHDSR